MYNKGTLKNGHLKKIQMAHHRLSPVTRNMYEVISEIYRIVKKTLHMVRRKQRSVVQVHERRRFRWRQLKNIFIMMVTQNWEVVSTRDAFKIKAWISPYVDAEYSMVEVQRTQVFDTRFDPSWLFKTQDMSGVSRASGHITYRKTSAYKRLVHIQVHAVHVMSRCNSYPDSLYSGKFNL